MIDIENSLGLTGFVEGDQLIYNITKSLYLRTKAGEFAYVRQAAIAAGIITEGRSPGSRLRKPVAPKPR